MDRTRRPKGGSCRGYSRGKKPTRAARGRESLKGGREDEDEKRKTAPAASRGSRVEEGEGRRGGCFNAGKKDRDGVLGGGKGCQEAFDEEEEDEDETEEEEIKEIEVEEEKKRRREEEDKSRSAKSQRSRSEVELVTESN
ncbi:hypothetical protein MGYG_01655 [Nannizzia gypsea CBS 118893]|uniref:Uncharacterized protein n=1 Tax=Arthroderma gypseum (strain ATCC MYA-4604 / CBS 118893) TaxID=535722 RepID=E5R268_ARTGP|nr:hypothetical protein MGYG_01655 [Nannizzia gypsea CBS 118893]EFQ98632.1 hypothetical protein MGYG_01655 [Nannizzia gypsea CBS 118893]